MTTALCFRRRLLASLTLMSLGLALQAHASVPKAVTAGEPKIEAGEGPALFIWHDDKGWHLRWTAPAPAPEVAALGETGAMAGASTKKKARKGTAFTGIVRASEGRLKYVRPKMKGGNDSLNRVDQLRAFFKSEAAGEIEGMDFQVPEEAGSIYLELFIDYDVLSPQSVFLGKDRAHPDEVSPHIQIRLAE